MSDIFERISEYGIVPLVTLDDPNDAVPLARALVAGGIPIAEVTFRTSAGGEAIKRMAKEVPEIIVGCPGTVVPSDIEEAMNFGLKVVKFFPAEAYGGINTLKALAGPFGAMKFVPTGGVGLNNLTDYLDLPNVAAVGGSFVPPSKLVKAKDWDGITKLCQQIVAKVMDFSVGHVGINAGDPDNAGKVTDQVAALFGTDKREGDISFFSGNLVEVMKKPFVGTHGHICVDTRDLRRAMALLKRKGVEFDEANFMYDAKGKLVTAYLKNEIGGFAFHIRQRPAC